MRAADGVRVRVCPCRIDGFFPLHEYADEKEAKAITGHQCDLEAGGSGLLDLYYGEDMPWLPPRPNPSPNPNPGSPNPYRPHPR